MLRVVAKIERSQIAEISATGHTGYSSSGTDIVCASVSTLIQALHLGLEEVIGLGPDELDAIYDDAAPFMQIRWRSRDHACSVLAWTIFKSIKAVAHEFPDFVSVDEVDLDLEGQKR